MVGWSPEVIFFIADGWYTSPSASAAYCSCVLVRVRALELVFTVTYPHLPNHPTILHTYMTWSSINTRFFKQGGSRKEEKEEEMVAVCARVHTHTQSQSQGNVLTFDLHERARVS